MNHYNVKESIPPEVTAIRNDVQRLAEAFEEFKRDRIEKDQRINARWYQIFLSLSLSLLSATGSVVWFASNADSRIQRNFESVRALQVNDQRLIDIASRLARTEAIVTLTDARTSRIERSMDMERE